MSVIDTHPLPRPFSLHRYTSSANEMKASVLASALVVVPELLRA